MDKLEKKTQLWLFPAQKWRSEDKDAKRQSSWVQKEAKDKLIQMANHHKNDKRVLGGKVKIDNGLPEFWNLDFQIIFDAASAAVKYDLSFSEQTSI